MEIRDALIQQNPSLALQRAAADEIARLDAEIARLGARAAYLDDVASNLLTAALMQPGGTK